MSNKYGNREHPINLIDSSIKIPIQSNKKDIPSVVAMYSFAGCFISMMLIILLFDANKTALLVDFILFIIIIVPSAILAKRVDFIGEIVLNKKEVIIKLNGVNPETYQLKDISLKLKYFGYDGEQGFLQKRPKSGFLNFIELSTEKTSYKFQIYLTFYALRAINIYSEAWNINNYTYEFTDTWNNKLEKLPSE
jgi:hypothetical protein